MDWRVRDLTKPESSLFKLWKLNILKPRHFNYKESFLYSIGDYVLFLVQHSGNHKNDKIANFTWKKVCFRVPLSGSTCPEFKIRLNLSNSFTTQILNVCALHKARFSPYLIMYRSTLLMYISALPAFTT